MLPAYCANMAPPFVKYWHGWNQPISVRLFGSHKTVAGFAAGVVTSVIVAYAQARFGPAVFLRWLTHDWLFVGLVSGLGAMGGDLAKSFFKRRRGIAPGKAWIPFDQLDFVMGALLLLAFVVPLSLGDVALILVFTFIADVAVNHASFRVGIRDTPW